MDPMYAPGIVGTGETAFMRHPDPACSTAGLLAEAAELALADAGLALADVDGLGVASFTLRPDRAIDLAWQMGLGLRWCMQDEMGAPALSTCCARPGWRCRRVRRALSCW